MVVRIRLGSETFTVGRQKKPPPPSHPTKKLNIFWTQSFDASFSKLQAELDENSREIATGQLLSKETRKKLSEMTKAFRKAADDQKLVDVKTLLRAYQAEIDNLTKRIKTSESLVLKIYTAVGELPDPAPILATSLAEFDAATAQTERVAELEAKLDTANASIKKLNEKLKELEKSQSEFDLLLQDQVKLKQMEMLEENELIIKAGREREEALQDKIQQLSHTLEEQEKSHALAQAKLLEGSVEGVDVASSHLSQLELVLGELERARDHASTLAHENESLRRQIQTSGELSAEGTAVVSEPLLLQLEKQEKELAQMLDQLKSVKSEKMSSERAYEELVGQLKSQTAANETRILELTSQLETMSDYQAIKNELEVLKYVEFPEESDHLERKDETSAMVALLRKAKTQQQTITQLQNDCNKAQVELADALNQLHSANSQIRDLSALNARLESDLLSAPQAPTQEPLMPIPPNAPSTGGLLPIVTSQRDRFRARNLELEESVRAAQDEISELQKTLAALRADNAQLQSRYKGSPTSRPDYIALSPEVYKDVTERYCNPSDESNPFQEFRLKETNRRYKALNLADRTALSLMRISLANRTTRLLLVVYLVLVHLVITYLLFFPTENA
ncbi:hypothetical protein L0F63_006413 [Massospora cicadina]|nr:hypothetical protein L0F63_006413 [Massospora cicadina]